MRNDSSDTNREAKEVLQKSGADHGLAVAKASLSLVPVIGGALSSLLNDYLPDSRMKRLCQFMEELAGDFTELSDKVDEEYVKSEDFAYLFEQTLRQSQWTRHEGKLCALRSILTKSACDVGTPQSRKEAFLTVIDQVTPSQMRVLSTIAELSNKHGSFGVSELVVVFATHTENDDEFYYIAIRNLELLSLIVPASPEKRAKYPPGTAGSLPKWQLTKFGEQFIHYLGQ